MEQVISFNIHLSLLHMKPKTSKSAYWKLPFHAWFFYDPKEL